MSEQKFRAYRAEEKEGRMTAGLVEANIDELDRGDVVVRVAFSSVNYKDALGATGKGKIYKKLPIIGGIDLAGEVVRSSDPRFKVGDQVVATGCGLGESHDGGYAEYARLPSDWIVPLPRDLSLEDAMIFGTAGFTAAICVQRLEDNGQAPNKGDIIVTGASGGVGMMAIAMLAGLGYGVVAVSGKPELAPFLKDIGAKTVVAPSELKLGSRPLESARWAGAIDNVGGDLLGGILRHIDLWGNVASVGLAGGATFQATVMPHILRGVSVLGISSANCPIPLRHRLWSRMAGDLKPKSLKAILTETVGLDELDGVFQRMLARKTHGRIVVRCASERS